LCCFCTIGSTGGTEVIAVTLLAHETKEMFEWSFRCFASVFKVPPSSVFTDGDQRIAQAVILLSEEVGCSMADIDSLTEAPWKGALQNNLCVYHLSQNFFTNVRPVFGNDLSNWRKCMNLFWRIAPHQHCARTHTRTCARRQGVRSGSALTSDEIQNLELDHITGTSETTTHLGS